jgi:hypothetical protein
MTAEDESMQARPNRKDRRKVNALAKKTKPLSKQPQRLKRPRGALYRFIIAGYISTGEAHKRGYMGKAELMRGRP